MLPFASVSNFLNSGTDVVAPLRPQKRGTSTVFAVRTQRRNAHFDLGCLNADQGMAKLSLAPHMPNMMAIATTPAAVAPPIRKRSA